MKRLMLILTLALASICAARADGDSPAVPDPVLEDIVRSYIPWTSAEFSGKLNCDLLPLSPTVKMYMECDTLLQISVRAPLVGEVGRLELTPSRFMVVNKMKRTYCSEDAAKLLEIYPGLIRDLQSLFLARVVVFGSGPLAYDNVARVEIEEDREGGWMLIPETGGNALDIRYGYLVGAGSRTRALVANIAGKGDLEVRYDYRNRGEQMDIRFDNGRKKPFEARFDFSSVRWGGTAMTPIKLDNYQRLSVKELMRSLGIS